MKHDHCNRKGDTREILLFYFQCMLNLINHHGFISLFSEKTSPDGNPDPLLQLYVACQKGMTYTVETLLKGGVNMNFLNEIGASPLYIACQRGHGEVVRLLLENGADVHLGEQSEYIPFYVACQRGHDEIVKLMLDKGANINSCKSDGASPLFIAC